MAATTSSPEISMTIAAVRRKWIALCALCLGFLMLWKTTLEKQPVFLGGPSEESFDEGLVKELSRELYTENLAPCGEVCQYSGTPLRSNTAPYKQLQKQINCANIMKRMAYKNHSITYPPPSGPPPGTYEEFTQFGKCPILDPMYFVEFLPGMKYMNRTYGSEELQNLVDQVRRGVNVNAYNDSGCMFKIIQQYSKTFTNRSGLVIGTQYPWLESMLLAQDAKHVTTLEYGHLALEHPSLEVYNPYDFARRYVLGDVMPFQFAVTFSSLEHSGLGRYGDPLNPFGDLEAMAQIWCMLQPGGILIVAVPGMERGDASYIQWNAHRVYGSERLSQFTANWKFQHMVKCEDMHIILVLEKPFE